MSVAEPASNPTEVIDHLAAAPERERMWPAQGIGRHVLVIASILLLTIIANLNTLSRKYVIMDRSGFTLDSRYIIELDPRSRSLQWSDRADLLEAVFVEAAVAAQATALHQTPGNLEALAERAKALSDPAQYSEFGFVNYFKQDYWWPKGISGLYRPLTSITYWWNFAPIRAVPPAEWEKMRDAQPEEYHRIHTTALVRFHWTNTILHGIAAVLAYFLMLAICGRFWVSVFTAAIFSTHPIAVESVANIIGRADIFAAMAVFTTLLLYIRSTKVRSGWRLPWLFLAFLVTAIGAHCKESAIAVVPCVVAYEIIFRYRPRIEGLFTGVNGWFDDLTRWIGDFIGATLRFAVCGWIFLLPAVAIWWITREWVFANSTPPEEPFLDNPIRGNPYWGLVKDNPVAGLLEGRITALKVVALLLGKMVWPLNLSADYSFNEIRILKLNWATFTLGMAMVMLIGAIGLAAWGWISRRAGKTWIPQVAVATGLVAVVAVRMLLRVLRVSPETHWEDVGTILLACVPLAAFVLGLVLWARGARPAAYMIAFFFIASLPTSNLIKVIGSIMAERFMYLPLFGFAGAAALLVFWLGEKLINRLRPPAADARAVSSPMQFVPHAVMVLVVVLYTARTLHRNLAWRSDELLWESAIQVSTNAFRCYQSYAFALYENAQIDRHRGKIDDAEYKSRVLKMIEIDEKGLQIVDVLPHEMNSARMYLHLGMYYAEMGRLASDKSKPDQLTPEARQWFEKSVDILQRAVPIDRAFSKLNKRKEIIRLKPMNEISEAGLAPVYLILGESQVRLGRFDDAIETFRYVQLLDPLSAVSYLQIGVIRLNQNKIDDALTSLLQAVILDPSRNEPWPLLQGIYTQYLNTPDAISINGNSRQVNANLPLVAQHVRTAMRDLIRIMVKARQVEFARQLRRQAIDIHRVTPGVIDVLFEEAGIPVEPPREELKKWR